MKSHRIKGTNMFFVTRTMIIQTNSTFEEITKAFEEEDASDDNMTIEMSVFDDGGEVVVFHAIKVHSEVKAIEPNESSEVADETSSA